MQAEERTHASNPAEGPSNGQSTGSPSNGRRGGHEEEHSVEMDLPEVSKKAVVIIAAVVVVLFAALFFIGWLPHRHRMDEAKNEAKQAVESKPVVNVAAPKRSTPTVDLILPADVQAFQSTAIYARTNGYLQPLSQGIDIGAEVKAGQLLAQISAPEVDAEIEQADAALQQANVITGRANNEYAFAKATYDRYSGLAQSGGVTQQQLDEKRSAFNIANSSLKAAQANVAAAQASLKRLTELQGFQKIVAPFDGVITARNYDAGALIATTNTGAGRELFRIAETDRLRVFLNVPQTYATEVKAGQDADLLVRNYPGVPFTGKVARSTGVIDPATRTMRVEVDIPNAEHKLFPGMWGQLRFKIGQEKPPMVVPTGALVFGPGGSSVALVDAGAKVRFVNVIVGRDFGSEAEVTSGLNGDERVVTNPSDRLADGVEVKVAAAKPAGGPQSASSAATRPTASAQ